MSPKQLAAVLCIKNCNNAHPHQLLSTSSSIVWRPCCFLVCCDSEPPQSSSLLSYIHGAERKRGDPTVSRGGLMLLTAHATPGCTVASMQLKLHAL